MSSTLSAPALAALIGDLTAHVTSECTAVDLEARFDDMLNECYSFEKVGGPFAGMDPARVLKEVDPVAYRCGVAEMSNDDTTEVDGETYDTGDVEKARESFVDDLNSELSDRENDLNDAKTDEDRDESEVNGLKGQIEVLEAQIAAVERHSF